MERRDTNPALDRVQSRWRCHFWVLGSESALILKTIRGGREVRGARWVQAGALALGISWLAPGLLPAQLVRAPRYGSNVDNPAPQLNLPPLPPALTPHGTVVEDIVVRVDDQIISRSDVARAEQQMQEEAAQSNVPAAELAQRQRDMLRDMIDQQLLLARAKELGLNADADVIRQLDDIRKQNKMDSLDDLEKAARQQGVNFEDFKAKIRNQILAQQVVRDEVGRRLQMTEAEEKRYYEEHLKDFDQPEQIRLSEILVPLAETASQAEIEQGQQKANGIKTQVMQGADFAALAKKVSGGPSAAQGGELGLFKRGALAPVLEEQTFNLKPGESTQPIRTRQGFVILKVEDHIAVGPAPMKSVQPQIQEAMYVAQMQPAMRAYLSKLREQSYVDVQPGFVDSGSTGGETKPVFTAYAPPVVKKKVVAKNKPRFVRAGATSTAALSKPVVASPDTTGTRTITGPDAKPAIDATTGLASISPPKTTTTANGKKVAKVKREKVRFGQAPTHALPGDNSEATTTTDGGVIASGAEQPRSAGLGTAQAAAPVETANLSDNPLTPVAPVRAKTRFAAKEAEVKEKKAKTVSAKQVEKAAATPTPITAEEKAAQQTQAAPLGVAGVDTSKKPKKPKRAKGAPKERLENKPAAAPVAAPTVAPTASPALAPTADTPPSTKPAGAAATAPPPPER